MADWFTKAFGAAVDDVRAKLIEEGWFGRDMGPNHHPPGRAQSLWDQMPSPDSTDRRFDHGIDR